ncbi:MAG: glycosyltransferase [Gemmataceae bacterium]|nr:glycosyltransferase [Gemmataceae bacterium]
MAEKVIVVQPGRGEVTDVPEGPPVAVAGTNLASILIPCCGQLEYTRLCVPGVLRHSRQPFELIFVDVGALDGTAEYLAGLAAGSGVRIEVVRAGTDLDIPWACREALARARGEYLVLLNNDTVVTEGWLHQLIALASLSQAVGLVGPMSNYATPPQLIETVPYRVEPRRSPGKEGGAAGEALVDVQAVGAFARQVREEQRGKWLEAERLGGFCLLVKREVLKRIGPLESEGLGLFDTDVLSAKARQAGYTLAVCRDLFVHHFGTRTFAHGAPAAQASP